MAPHIAVCGTGDRARARWPETAGAPAGATSALGSNLRSIPPSVPTETRQGLVPLGHRLRPTGDRGDSGWGAVPAPRSAPFARCALRPLQDVGSAVRYCTRCGCDLPRCGLPVATPCGPKTSRLSYLESPCRAIRGRSGRAPALILLAATPSRPSQAIPGRKIMPPQQLRHTYLQCGAGTNRMAQPARRPRCDPRVGLRRDVTPVRAGSVSTERQRGPEFNALVAPACG